MQPSTVPVTEAAERLEVSVSRVQALIDSAELEVEFAPNAESLFEVTEPSLERYEQRRRRASEVTADSVMTLGVAARILGTSEAEVAARISVGDLDGVEVDGITYVGLQSCSDGQRIALDGSGDVPRAHQPPVPGA